MDKHLILHLTLLEDIGPERIQKIIRSDVTASDLYAFSHVDWMNIFGFTDITAEKLATGLADKKVLERELYLIEEHNINWMTIADDMYPALLKEIYSPPAVLYFQGNSFSAKCLAVVGARKANEYGKRAVDALVPDLVAAGYAIVSGGAIGLDTMAHEAALQCGGKTIAILGSGLLKPYPSSNKNLFKRIVESGGIVASSYPLMMESLPHNFPARNRIVTGLSRGCLVVQAAQKSGALISAYCAMEQGREVFAVPGLFDDELSAGCNQIIQQGARLVMSSADILSEFGDRIIQPDKRVIEQKALQMSISSDPSIHSSLAQSSLHSNWAPGWRETETGLKTLRANGGEGSNQKDVSLSARPECPAGVYRRMEKEISSQIYSETQQHILRVCKNATSFDDITVITQLSSDVVRAELFNLQIDGVVSQDFTGMWMAVR